MECVFVKRVSLVRTVHKVRQTVVLLSTVSLCGFQMFSSPLFFVFCKFEVISTHDDFHNQQQTFSAISIRIHLQTDLTATTSCLPQIFLKTFSHKTTFIQICPVHYFLHEVNAALELNVHPHVNTSAKHAPCKMLV